MREQGNLLLPILFIVSQPQVRSNASRVNLNFNSHPIDSQKTPADQSAGQGEERLVNVRPLFVTHAQSPELIRPTKFPFDHPSPSLQPLPCPVLRFARKGMMRL